jgi:hypothetical protein
MFVNEIHVDGIIVVEINVVLNYWMWNNFRWNSCSSMGQHVLDTNDGKQLS